jgi:antibiotic biosynthesis monooxygenase (ABM) superfamily enzyme
MSCSIAPPIFGLSTSFKTLPLYPRERVPGRQKESWWTSESVWTLWGTENLLLLPEIGSRLRGFPARSLVSTITLSPLLYFIVLPLKLLSDVSFFSLLPSLTLETSFSLRYLAGLSTCQYNSI